MKNSETLKLASIVLLTAVLAGCGTTKPSTSSVTSTPRKTNPNFEGTKLLWNADAEKKYASVTQDHIKYDMYSKILTFNDERIKMEELAGKLEPSQSVTFACHTYEGASSLEPVVEIMKIIDRSEIDAKNVYLRCCCTGFTKKETQGVTIENDGSITVNGATTPPSDLPNALSGDRFVSIGGDGRSTPDFGRVSEILTVVDSSRIKELILINRGLQVKIAAEIFQPNEDGSEDVLSAPQMTMGLDGMSSISVVANHSGFQGHGFPRQDAYFQEDLANLGMRFSAGASFIGDHTRISGVIVLVKETDRAESFSMGAVPIYGYSATKIVAPFSVVLPPDADYVEFETAAIDGKKTMVRVTASPMDDRGQSREQRRASRAKR